MSGHPPDLLSGEQQHPEQNESTVNYVAMEMAQGPSANATAAAAQDDDDNDDDDDDDMSMAPSITSSVLTADGIHDYPGFICVCFVILVGDMSRGVFFPSMWPLVESLGGSQVMLGYSVAAFSFGRVLVNPLFGSWSHQIGYSKTLLLSCNILLVGTLLYAQIENIGRPEFLIVAQTVLGIGSGTLGVTRAFVADVTARRNRTTYMAWITAVQYAGFTVTPAFGALFNKVFGDKSFGFGLFRLDMFTAPAYFMTIVVAGTIFMLLTFFQDRQRCHVAQPNRKKSQKRQAIDEVANSMTCVKLTVYDCCVLGCMLLNVSTKGSIAVFETLGIAIAQDYFDMLASRAGVIIAACGLVGVAVLLNMGRLEQKFSDVHIITFGMVVMAAGIASLTTIQRDYHNPSWSYTIAIFMIYSVGYPIGHTAVIGLFSKSKCLHRLILRCVDGNLALPYSFSLLARSSCGTTTTRNIAWLVCVGRFFGSNVLSSHVGIHRQLQYDSYTVCNPYWCPVGFDRICIVGSTNVDTAVNLIKEL